MKMPDFHKFYKSYMSNDTYQKQRILAGIQPIFEMDDTMKQQKEQEKEYLRQKSEYEKKMKEEQEKAKKNKDESQSTNISSQTNIPQDYNIGKTSSITDGTDMTNINNDEFQNNFKIKSELDSYSGT